MSDFNGFDNETIRQVTMSKRFLAADRAKLDIAEIGSWDVHLLREFRLLVPIDVQALTVLTGDTEPMVRLPLLLAGPNGQGVADPEDGMPEPFAPGLPRPHGVHLHWAMPDALLRGALTERADGSANRLSLPVLPDRWVVLRILLPNGATNPVVTAWVLEADRAIAVPLPTWREDAAVPAGIVPAGETLAPEQLTGTVGGAVSWSGIYDSVLNRFAFHDPLDDLDAVAPDGVDQQCVSYTVAGWWKDPDHDPLDAARSTDSLHELLDRLRWRLMYEWGDASAELAKGKAEFDLRKALGLTTAERWSSQRPLDIPGQRAAGPGMPFDVLSPTLINQSFYAATSVFAKEAVTRYQVPPWHLRASLMHGSVYGVPVNQTPAIDNRPPANQLRVALGQHDDDVLAALATSATASVNERRSTERLLAAFTSQKMNRLAAPNGIVELEELEHSAAFSSIPGGSAGTDRYLQRVQTGGVGGLDIGRNAALLADTTRITKAATPATPSRHARPGAQQPIGNSAEVTIAWNDRPTLVKAAELAVHEIARSRVGDVLAPTEARVVDRPAARFTFPDEPLVAIRGASRSLRHGNDGRSSADSKLSCRWPTHVITEISGVIAPSRFISSLGNGAIPPEITTLAREAVLHDPYHDRWLTEAVSPSPAARTAVFNRLRAESVMRFGADGTYDGTTQAFVPTPVRQRASRRRGLGASRPIEPGLRVQQAAVSDELMKFSLYRGIDPDLVGVTAWSQPWVPMWLEWEVAVDGLDPPSLESWQLGQIDLERPAPASAVEGESVVLRGRALLTTGAASTLHDAVIDWLKAEDARDATGGDGGEVDETTETKLRTLATAVENIDLVTAALDGMRHQLLGLPVSDGLRRTIDVDGTTLTPPAPIAEPDLLMAGRVTLTRARLLDVFGRTLDVPVNAVVVPTRADVPDQPGTMAVPPRLMRPARWQFRPVSSGTEAGSEGVEGRVDQIEPALQVNPVAGFLLPDHLDESLEVFAVDGSPIGELLHESVSGGVMWEIAAGRIGPADSGPNFGLAPEQLALGGIAAGLIAADAAARAGTPIDPDGPHESALSALLRAIDTTLWTVDTFSTLGGEHVAGLVGRPIAVVRAQLRLELQPPDDIDLSDPVRAGEWAAAEQEVARHAFPVRIGELTRTDDGVLGFFVDDDWSKFRLVDKTIAGVASDGGRSRGQLGLYSANAGMPATSVIDHPYIAGTDEADTLLLHVGQTVTLTILMHPGGKASLTSGVLPRKAIALARDWVAPGLAAIAPSLRTGPVLVETDLDIDGQVRLPKVSVFGTDQNFWWRDTPATWRSDAILAATQTALLPETPAELRDGWIRVAPTPPPSATTQGGTP